MAKYDEYQGQLFDAVKSKRVDGSLMSTRFNVVDKLSPVIEKNDVPYITTFAPYSVYLATILEGKESVEANITLEDFFDLKAKTASANDIVFKTMIGFNKISASVPDDVKEPEDEISPAFTTALSMGEFKGKTPGDIILSAVDKVAAVGSLKKHADFCGKNLAKYPGNQKFIDAVNAAIDLYELDLLEAEKELTNEGKNVNESIANEFVIHEPIDKYYSKKTQSIDNEIYNKCYKWKAAVRPGNNYPYHLEIINYWAPIGHTQSGLTPIQTAKKRYEIKKVFDLTMAQWTSLIEKLSLNTESCHNLFYPEMRKKDDSYSYRNRAV